MHLYYHLRFRNINLKFKSKKIVTQTYKNFGEQFKQSF